MDDSIIALNPASSLAQASYPYRARIWLGLYPVSTLPVKTLNSESQVVIFSVSVGPYISHQDCVISD
eukprot:scaffold98548_cov30-Cyclotella_meneghiniana.AAC.1